MVIDHRAALALEIPAVEAAYTARDTMLYALGLGFGSNPLAASELRYVYERDLRAFPTMALTLGVTSLRALDLGIDFARVVHYGQELVLHRPLPVAATVVARSRITDMIDRGTGKGMLLLLERSLSDQATGELLAVTTMTALCRGDGGSGRPATTRIERAPVPERPADHTVALRTLPQQALLYRLNGDYNALHADPEAARAAGFERPILHGLATLGLAARALANAVASGNADGLERIDGRFTAPFHPGETLQVEAWCTGDELRFRAGSLERGVIVLADGSARFAAGV